MDQGLIDSVVVPAQVAWLPIDDQVVVHRPGARRGYALDPSASILWRCLDGDSTIGDVLADVADVAGVPLAVVTADSLPVVQSWLAAGIAMVLDPAANEHAPEHEHEHEHEHGRRWRRLLPPPNG